MFLLPYGVIKNEWICLEQSLNSLYVLGLAASGHWSTRQWYMVGRFQMDESRYSIHHRPTGGDCSRRNSAFTLEYILHVAGQFLYPRVSACRRLLYMSTCIGDKIVASLSIVARLVLDTIKETQVGPWHKWIVIMSPRYSLQVARPGYM